MNDKLLNKIDIILEYVYTITKENSNYSKLKDSTLEKIELFKHDSDKFKEHEFESNIKVIIYDGGMFGMGFDLCTNSFILFTEIYSTIPYTLIKDKI
jgi:hypothetical protein